MVEKLKNREALAQHFGELGFKLGAEVGTCYGHYALKLFKHIPGLTLLMVDNWDNAETRHRENKREGHNVEKECRERLAPYDAVIVKKDSVEAAKFVADNSLDFVYIDAAHDYDNVKADIAAWVPKVKTGGIVSGDDYYIFPNSGNDGVIKAVDEYVAAHNIDLQVTAWDNNNPERDERQPAWWFVK